MPDLGIEVLFKGTNMLRLLQGLWVAMRISLISIAVSIPLGIIVGALMTVKNMAVKAVFKVYLEVIRIMPQLVLLFLVTQLPLTHLLLSQASLTKALKLNLCLSFLLLCFRPIQINKALKPQNKDIPEP